MAKSFHRLTHIVALCKEGFWRKWFGAIWFVASFFIVFRDEFWMPTDVSNWRIINMIPHISLRSWIIGTLVMVIIYIIEASYRQVSKLYAQLNVLDPISPLEIIFDPNNPARRFWSVEQLKNENGEPLPPFWEHRVAIKNNSTKTLRNVSVTTERIGPMPERPYDNVFDKVKKVSCDIKPGCWELVPVMRWSTNKKQVGMLAGESALAYGPIVITASADDVVPSVRVFQFDYQTDQMLFDEIPTSALGDRQTNIQPDPCVGLFAPLQIEAFQLAKDICKYRKEFEPKPSFDNWKTEKEKLEKLEKRIDWAQRLMNGYQLRFEKRDKEIELKFGERGIRVPMSSEPIKPEDKIALWVEELVALAHKIDGIQLSVGVRE
jgi:hypothetical protein